MKTLNENYIKLNKHSRLYGLENPLIGLTGGIATGKSSVGRYFKEKELALIDADKLVHQIYQDPKTIDIVSHLSPESIVDNQISFKKLRSVFFNSPEIKKELENYIYNHLPDQFLKSCPQDKKSVVIYEVPLLFEKNLQENFDFIITVSSTLELQRTRLNERDQMDDQTTLKIIQSQLPLAEKEKRADFLIENNGDLDHLFFQAQKFIDQFLVG